LCLCSLFALLLPAAVGSAVATAEPILYVDKGNPDCSNAGTGSLTQPFCTIGAAAAVVTAGQTVQVNSGTYDETVNVSTSGTSTEPISFEAAPANTPTVTGSPNGSGYGFYMLSRSYVAVRGFTITGSRGDGILVKNSSNVTIQGNHVSFAGQPDAGKLAKGIRLDTVTDSIVSANIVDHNTDFGIYLLGGSTRNQIVGNQVSANAQVIKRAASGIRLYSSTANTISSNVSHDNEDSGIELYTGSNNNLVVNNVTYNNGDHGIDNYVSNSNRIVANSVYRNVTAGINVEGNSTGATIANNISVDNGISSPRTHGDIRVEAGSTSGTTMDYDLVYLSAADTLLIWNSVNYTSLTAFKAATGQEAHGAQGDPKWENAVGGDFHLTAGSPAIDSANSGASGQQATDVEGRARVDDPTIPDTGAGPRTYDDRGAYEFDAVPLDHIEITPSSASISAGGSRSYTAQGFDAANNSLGDVTASTTFSISPDGSCTGNVCTATSAGPHTVTGNNSGKTSSGSLTVTASVLDHLVLSPASATITSGGSQAYTAEGRDQYENSLGDVTASTTFTIAPDGSCTGASCSATVAGVHTVTGTKSGKTGTASVQVNAGSLNHIVLSPSSATISAGGSQSYTAEGFDASNNSLGDVTAFTTFSISPNGVCTGASCTATTAGPHTVTGNNTGKTSSASLTVNVGALDHLVLSPALATISPGASQAYTAQGRDQYENSLGDLTASTTFTITPDGSCTGATCSASVAGSHTVTGTSAGKTGTASLQVNAPSVDHIVITPSSATIAAGGSQPYTAEGFDASNNSLGDVTASTTFSISPNGSCTGASCSATVAGPHTVTGNNGGKTSTASLTVTAGVLDHLALSPASATISAGGSQAYTAQGRDQYDNSLGDLTASTTFTIAPNGSCTGATCTASATGAHTVTGTSAGKTGTASLQVGAGSLDHTVISPSSATISVGSSQAYSAEGFDASGNSIGNVTGFTTFSIAPDGSCLGATCTPTSGGPHTVTGNDGGKTNTASLNVGFVRNPGFETDTSGWNTSGSGTGITLARVAGGHTGSWSAQLANTGTASNSCSLNDSPNWVATTVAATYTGSIWVRADAAGKPLKLRFREYSASGTLLGTATAQITLTTAWQQVTVTYTVAAPGSTLDLNAYLSSADAPPGTCFYADDAAVLRP